MRARWFIAAVWLVCLWLHAASATAQAPVPIALPDPAYPPIAKAAHVHGDVVASFSVDSDGRATSVQILSGQPMLRSSVTAALANWRFRVPLPMGAETSFTATFTFASGVADEPDSLDFPPNYPCCGESMMGGESVVATIVSVDGSQRVARTNASLQPPGPWCADDANVTAPTSTNADDFVELRRAAYYDDAYAEYEVRVYRNGRVEWTGLRATAAHGARQAQIAPAAAEALLARFAQPNFWLRCSVRPPVPEVNPEPPDPDAPVNSADLRVPEIQLTASLGGHTKTIDASQRDMGNDYGGQRLAWAVDQAANTHRWRHPDAAMEPVRNMNEDLDFGKPGITLLMRAIYRLGGSGEWAGNGPRLDPMRTLLAAGESANAADESGWTPLMYLAWLRPSDEAVTRLLIAAGADARRRSLHGDTALLIAAQNGYFDLLLLAAGAEINGSNADGTTPIMPLARLAAQFGELEPLRKALAAGADPTAKDRQGRTALDYLAEGACDVTVTKPAPCPPQNKAFLADQARAMLVEAMQTWRSAHP